MRESFHQYLSASSPTVQYVPQHVHVPSSHAPQSQVIPSSPLHVPGVPLPMLGSLSSPALTFDGSSFDSHTDQFPLPDPAPCSDDGSQKPAYSYAALITAAINSQQTRRLTLNGIYEWILERFPFFRNAPKGWKVCAMFIFFSIGSIRPI